MIKPKISVIIPIYNIEQYLPRCVDSIVNQTYRDLQIILVDDGSTDGSRDICDYYQQKDERIQVIHKENGGLVTARKAGLEIAEGQYVGFVDGDDYVEPQFYQVLLNDIIESKADFVHSGYFLEEDGDRLITSQFESRMYEIGRNIGTDIIIDGLLGKGENIEITPSIWSKIFKRDFIRKCYSKVPESQSQGEDFLCLCICLLEGKYMRTHNIALYHYCMRKDSMMNTVNLSFAAEMGKLYLCLKNTFMEYGIYSRASQVLDDYFIRMLFGSIKKIDKYTECVHYYELETVDDLNGKRIVIYGAGNIGKDYYAQLSKYTTCTIVGWIDKKYTTFHYEYAKVEGVEKFKNLEYDIVVIAIKNEERARKVCQELEQIGVAKEKIWWKLPKSLI